MATPKDFAIALLNRLGLEVTDNRLISLVAFAGIEGGHWHNGARYNPFNTTLSTPGSQSVTQVGVKAYPDWPSGIEATARTMVQNNMHTIMDALKANADPRTFLHAITESAWCPGCNYDPFDPYALYQARANEQDSGTALATTGSGFVGKLKAHPIFASLVVLGIAGGFWYVYRHHGFHLPGFAHANPARRRRRRGGSSRVQSLLFSRRRFTPSSARAWARRHGYRSGKVDVTDQYIRLRQSPPSGFSRMRTKSFGQSGVKAVIGFR